jgi:hypothetical protein
MKVGTVLPTLMTSDDEDVRRTPDKRQQNTTPRTRTSPPACDVAAVPFPYLGEAGGDDAAPIESGEEFHGLDLVDDESSTGEDVGGAAGEGSGGPSERHEEADHTPSLSDSDSSGSDWELDQELEDDPRDDFFLDAPDGEPNEQGAWKVITPARVMPVNLGEIEEEWADDLEAEIRTVAARVLSEHIRLVGKSGLRRQSAQDLTEADVLDVVLSKSGRALVKALSEPGHDCSDEKMGFLINTALYLALIGKSPTVAYVGEAGENWLPTASRVESAPFCHLGKRGVCWRSWLELAADR